MKKTITGTKSQEIKNLSVSDDRLKQKPEGFGTGSVSSDFSGTVSDSSVAGSDTVSNLSENDEDTS